MKYDVICFGSATMDIFIETQSERVVEFYEGGNSKSYIAYRSGNKALIHEFHMDIGGGGTNVAACFSLMGLRTAYCGCLSEDRQGEEILSDLTKRNIDFLGHRTQAASDLSVILDSKKLHDRAILNHKGASTRLSFDKLNKGSLSSTWFYFSSLIDKSYETMLMLMRYAREKNIAVAFNPSIYQANKGFDNLREAILASQLIIMNKQEAQQIVSGDEITSLCRSLRSKGAEIVIITDADKGASLLYADTIYTSKPKQVNVVETTGAGDCFASSFLSGLIMGLSPEKSFQLAFINVESLILQVGAKQGLLSKEEALTRLSNDTREVIKKPI